MFRKILVALDYSDISKQALNEAIALAKATGAQLTILHVISASEDGYPDTSALYRVDIGYPDAEIYQEVMQRYAQQWQEFEEQSLKTLQSFARDAEMTGVTVDVAQYFGEPQSTICAVARHVNADLIVMGRRGHSGLGELILGSVSNYVVHHAPCSVLTVQQRSTAVSASKDTQTMQTPVLS